MDKLSYYLYMVDRKDDTEITHKKGKTSRRNYFYNSLHEETECCSYGVEN